MTKTPFIGHGDRVSDILDFVHTNVCGPMSTQARDGSLTSSHLLMIGLGLDMCI